MHRPDSSIKIKAIARVISIFLLLISLFLLLFPTPTSALGLGISPGKLEIHAVSGSYSNTKLVIINTGTTKLKYRVYTKEEVYKSWINIKPVEFILQRGENRTVDILIEPPPGAGGQHKAHICIISILPNYKGEGLAARAGIRVPVTLNISSTTNSLPSVSPDYKFDNTL